MFFWTLYVIGNKTRQFEAAKAINFLFSILWKFNKLEKEIAEKVKKNLQVNCEQDVSGNIYNEIIHLKAVYKSNLQENFLSPINLKKIKPWAAPF